MGAKSTNKVSQRLALIALVMALYNTYLEWLDKPNNSYLFYLTWIFVVLSVLAAKYTQKEQNR